MKKDNLEDFINQNRDSFEVHEPNEELWEKIVINEPKKISFTKYISWAAAVVIIFFISYFVHDFISKPNNNSKNNFAGNTKFEDCVIPDDVSETEAYYVSQVNLRMEELHHYSQNDPEIVKDIEFDFNELDSIYIELKNDLCDDVANEEVIEAMIENYMTKLEILEEILFQLKSINENNNKDENIEYEI